MNSPLGVVKKTSKSGKERHLKVVNSPLFKCAVSGNDPNTGRLAGAVGSFLGKLDDFEDSSTKKMTMTLGNRIIFKMGKFVLEGDEVEMELSNHMKDAGFGEHDEYPTHQKFVEIGINFGGVGKASYSHWVVHESCDLSYS